MCLTCLTTNYLKMPHDTKVDQSGSTENPPSESKYKQKELIILLEEKKVVEVLCLFLLASFKSH
jgi:hypothetical protein